MICKKCGWSVVTTNRSPIFLDECIYKIICLGNYSNRSHVLAVAKITSSNLLNARETLKKGHFLIFSGQALDVLKIRAILKEASIEHSISPYFKWEEEIKD